MTTEKVALEHSVQSMHIVVVGLGLIGASFAAALKKAGFAGRITGVVRRAATGDEALRRGIVDDVHEDVAEAVRGADVVMLAVPMLAMKAQLAALVPAFSARSSHCGPRKFWNCGR